MPFHKNHLTMAKGLILILENQIRIQSNLLQTLIQTNPQYHVVDVLVGKMTTKLATVLVGYGVQNAKMRAMNLIIVGKDSN